MSLTWDHDQVAEALKITPRMFRRRRPAMEAAGFPRPLPGLRGRWDPLAIEAWLATLRQPLTAAVAAGDDRALQAEMDRRAQAGLQSGT